MIALSKQDMQELDERMIHQYKVSLESMMKKGGKTLAVLVRNLYPDAHKILVLAGTGNSSAGGLFAARLLAEQGYTVRVVLSRFEMFLKDTPKLFLRELPATIMIIYAEEVSDEELRTYGSEADLVIDALMGYNVEGAPEGEVKRLIKCANESGKSVISFDLPSGLDPNEGAVYEPIVGASATLTLGMPKKGLFDDYSSPYVGTLYVADIGIPDVWYKEENIDPIQYDERGYLEVPESHSEYV